MVDFLRMIADITAAVCAGSAIMGFILFIILLAIMLAMVIIVRCWRRHVDKEDHK